MNISILLVIEEQVKRDKYHTLSPYNRKEIYQLIKTTNNSHYKEVYLGALSISYIRDIWIQSSISSTMIKVLSSINIYLKGGGYSNIRNDMKTLEKFSRKAPLDEEIFFSILGMIRTLDLISGKDMFNGYPVEEDTIDAELGADSIDPTGCVIAAFAHGLYDDEADATQRLVFWQWWLRSAVPTALTNQTFSLS
jgi:hypothetical protein